MGKVIAVAGGKGGTGKSIIAVNLAVLLSQHGKTLLTDTDVENPCTYTLMESEEVSQEDVKEFRPIIKKDKCRLCGVCVKLCPEHALVMLPNKEVMLMNTLCSGCTVCKLTCPHGAIEDGEYITGWIRSFKPKYQNLGLIVGELNPASRRAVNMTVAVVERALTHLEDYDYIVFDSPPGTGSGIYAIVRNADVTVGVTEPTRLGLLDLKKFYELYRKYKDPNSFVVVVNKYDLKGGIYDELLEFLNENGIKHFDIPYDEKMIEAYSKGIPIIELFPNTDSSKVIRKIAKYIIGRNTDEGRKVL